MKNNLKADPDRFFSPDNDYLLEYENTDSALPWRSHARLWIGRRSYLIPALLAGPAIWHTALEAWFAPAWVIGHRQKVARIEPETRRLYLTTAEFEPFTLGFSDTITIHYIEESADPTPLNMHEDAWSKGRRF